MPIDTAASSSPLHRRLRRLSERERADEAIAFIGQFHRENGLPEREARARIAEVTQDLARRGSYDHTAAELAYGARVAWRNHARCIGRLFWESLEVVDCRHVDEPDALVAHVIAHMETALGDGRIRSLITIFPPMRPTTTPIYIESAQITQYAGYAREDGSILGDPQNVEATRIAMSLGWEPPAARSRFDILPLMVRDAPGRRILFDIPPTAVREIPIRHPTYETIARLGLRWYAVPCVSGMILTIGGIDYPCAPFNGFYMCTEIASRDFADENRYDVLADVARALGDDPDASGAPFWKDRALFELNRAVTHSFEADGVTIVDHHAASRQYMDFDQRERAAGREPSASWTWIVPPQASSACPVYHLHMQDHRTVPNFYHARAIDGCWLQPQDEQSRRRRQRRRRFSFRWRAA